MRAIGGGLGIGVRAWRGGHRIGVRALRSFCGLKQKQEDSGSWRDQKREREREQAFRFLVGRARALKLKRARKKTMRFCLSLEHSVFGESESGATALFGEGQWIKSKGTRVFVEQKQEHLGFENFGPLF